MKKSLFRRLFVVFAMAALLPAQAFAESAELKLSLSTNFPNYYREEKIVIVVRNNEKKPVKISPSALTITQNGQSIYSTIGVPEGVTVAPGDTYEWAWDQKTNRNQLAKPGKFMVNYGRTLHIPFIINALQGSDGYFTIESPGHKEFFRVYLTNPQTIRDAIDSYYGKNNKHINGKIVDDRPKKSPYDTRWSWHLDPDDTSLSDISMEVCDGWPSDVEKDPAAFGAGRFCPWNSLVSGLK